MQFVPHPYQQTTIEFIESHPAAAILLGLGMGKTVSTLTAINNLKYDAFEVERVLIIAPLRVARDTWPAEIGKWSHLSHLTYSAVVGTAAQRRAALARDADIYIINRENVAWLIKELGDTWPFDMVVIDELSGFKSHQSQRFKALKKVRPQIKRIVGLTGTPAPNSLMDLWAQYALLDGGERLGPRIGRYRERYFVPGRRSGYVVYDWKLRPGAEDAIYDAVRDITISMRTTDYLELPEVTYTDVEVDIPRGAYGDLKRDMVAEIGDAVIDAGSAGVLCGRLQQLTSGAIYTEDGEVVEVHDAKIRALQDIVAEAQGNTVLVGYWFKHEAARVCEAIPGARVLKTSEDFTEWNAGEVPVGLIHPASAGHGLNLQAGGHIMVWLTTPWSAELYDQTNGRLHRQGQTEPVSIVHITARGSIDTRVAKAVAGKQATQARLVDAVRAELTG